MWNWIGSALIGLVGGAIVGLIISSLITEDEIEEVVEEDGDLYATIKKIQPNTVTIEEIDQYGNVDKVKQLKSDDGVSDSLYVGQRIYATN